MGGGEPLGGAGLLRCTPAEVEVGKVTFLSDGTWMVDQDDGDGETVYFACP